ncbi:MAG: MBL fold metallo-hydrolase [Bacteroidia bacterium]|nr:MBL fold metallo-hydrolase [Bacteroidia bacterium]
MRSIHLGGKLTKEYKAKYSVSPQWIAGAFRNYERVEMNSNILRIPSIILKQIQGSSKRSPAKPLPILPFNKDDFYGDKKRARLIWFGHSVILIRMNEMNILIDPMFGDDTAPIAPFRSARFSENTLDIIDELPPIDIVLLTHDHYDHLDYKSIQKLKSKVRQFLVPLGLSRHLKAWGVESRIDEFDWWENMDINGIRFTFTPTQHFSGRWINDRQMSLWGGWAIKSNIENIWISGDGGYASHFREIGAQLGPFDFAFMECGQYNDDWKPVHLFPHQSVQAARDANVKKAMPIHWAGFALSYHHKWKDPAEDFVESANDTRLEYLLPGLGACFGINDEISSPWWRSFE